MTGTKEIILGDKRVYHRVRRGTRRRAVAASIAIVAISYVAWAVGSIDEDTLIKQALVDISRIEHAARLFRADHGRCPDNMEELVSPPGEKQYLDSALDPWGKPFLLRCPAVFDPGGVQVLSGGPDGSLAGDDNITSL
jgi:type II secretory pathway pseudopilin PulG